MVNELKPHFTYADVRPALRLYRREVRDIVPVTREVLMRREMLRRGIKELRRTFKFDGSPISAAETAHLIGILARELYLLKDAVRYAEANPGVPPPVTSRPYNDLPPPAQEGDW